MSTVFENPAYHAARGAVRSMTRNAAMTCVTDGIRVDSVRYGFIETPLTRAQAPELNDAVIASTQMKRRGEPIEFAYGSLFLASDESSYVTGAELANLKGTLYGIATALPVLRRKSGHIINLSSVSGLKVSAPGGVVYSGTKFAIRAISEGLRQEVGSKVRVTSIAPGNVDSDLKYGTTGVAQAAVMDVCKTSIPARSVARAIAFAIEQPDDVDINEIVLRPTAQGSNEAPESDGGRSHRFQTRTAPAMVANRPPAETSGADWFSTIERAHLQ